MRKFVVLFSLRTVFFLIFQYWHLFRMDSKELVRKLSVRIITIIFLENTLCIFKKKEFCIYMLYTGSVCKIVVLFSLLTFILRFLYCHLLYMISKQLVRKVSTSRIFLENTLFIF